MKTTAVIFAAAVGILAIGAAVYMIDVDQTQQAELPTVTVEGGQMPAFDAEVGSVQVTEETMEVAVPDVDVTMEDTEVTVPGLKITPPADDS